MPGQLDRVKSRKRKNGSRVKSRKVSATRRRSPKTHPAAEGTSAGSGYSKAADPMEELSRISCECQQAAGRGRCSASPELGGQDGKENQHRTGTGLDVDKHEPVAMDCEESKSKSLFPDDDSNQILPVEQFFGNLDAVQDSPQRPSAPSACVERESRRRHYYAPEDSDEEVGFSSMQPDHTGDS